MKMIEVKALTRSRGRHEFDPGQVFKIAEADAKELVQANAVVVLASESKGRKPSQGE